MGFEKTIQTPFFTIDIDEDGRGWHFRLDDSIKEKPHKKALLNYIVAMHERGAVHINADHCTFPYLDRNVKLNRGGRKLDCVYTYQHRVYECEIKTEREVGLNRTWEQVREQAKYCRQLTLLVPKKKVEYCNGLIKQLGILNVVVDTYEIN